MESCLLNPKGAVFIYVYVTVAKIIYFLKAP